jgi:hypothetical protein
VDTRFFGWFVGAVLLLALLVNVVRLVTAPPLNRLARAARWRAVLATVVGALAAAQVAGVVSNHGESVWVAAAPTVAAATGVVIAMLGEWLLPRTRVSQGAVRTALLGLRTGLETKGLERCLWAGVATTALGLAVGWVSSGPDGRSGMRTWDSAAVTGAPYPGRDFTLPVVLGLGLLGLVTWAAIRVIEARPAMDPDEPDLDRAVRLGSRIRVLRWAAAGTLITGASLCLTVGMTMNDVTQRLRGLAHSSPRAPWDWAQNGAFAMSALGLAALVGAIVAVLWDTPAIPPARRTVPGDNSLDSRVSR